MDYHVNLKIDREILTCETCARHCNGYTALCMWQEFQTGLRKRYVCEQQTTFLHVSAA